MNYRSVFFYRNLNVLSFVFSQDPLTSLKDEEEVWTNYVSLDIINGVNLRHKFSMKDFRRGIVDNNGVHIRSIRQIKYHTHIPCIVENTYTEEKLLAYTKFDNKSTVFSAFSLGRRDLGSCYSNLPCNEYRRVSSSIEVEFPSYVENS